MKFAVRNAFLLLAGLLPILLFPLSATTPEARAAAAEVRVLATTYPVYLLTRAVAQASPGVRVELLIPARTGCPHEYALTPGDVRRLVTAKIVVINGLGMVIYQGARQIELWAKVDKAPVDQMFKTIGEIVAEMK